MILTTILQLLPIHVIDLRQFFRTHLLSGTEVAVCLGFSALVFVWIELGKILTCWRHKEQELQLVG
ncbi:cation-transporting P-type ATPase [Thermostichus vulcanus NIES-2134]|nr:cation-transporting P-type ATPase [Thermostichus vulcanus NIES-2134]